MVDAHETVPLDPLEVSQAVPATILCADDDRHYCQILSRAFEKEGYRVETAFDGEEALEKIRSVRPQLVTLDVMLPKRDGFQVLESLRREESDEARVPVVLVSGCSLTADYEARATALLANEVLQKPVPLEKLLGVVADHVAGGSTAARVTSGDPTEALAGTLEELPIAALLHQLHGLRATGVLQVQAGKKRKQIQLREGAPIAVRSNLVTETLGNLLLASGKITEDVLHASLLRVKRGEGMHGQILKAMHMLDEADLAIALRRQAIQKLLEMFTWERGRFRFHRGARLKSANALTLKKSPARLIWKGIQKEAPIGPIDQFLEDNGRKAIVPGESAFYRHQDVDLGPDAERWIEQADGSVLLGAILPQEERARRELYGLIVLELLELREPSNKRRLAHQPRRIREVKRRVPPDEVRVTSPESEEETLRRQLAEMAARIRDQDCFQVLDVDRRANDEQIRGAYAQLAKQTHPDRFTGASEALVRLAEEVFGAIAHAYDEIGARDARMAYLKKKQGEAEMEKELEIGHRAVEAELEFQKGTTALKAGAIETALPHFEMAARTYPDEGEYLAYFGWTWYLAAPNEADRAKKAMAMVEKGRQLAPEREKPYLFLGRLCQATNRSDAAEKMFMRAVQLDPDSVEALRELRLIDMRREKSKSFVSKILRRA